MFVFFQPLSVWFLTPTHICGYSLCFLMDCMAGIRKGMEQGKFFGCVLDGCMRIEGRDIVLVSSLPFRP